MAKMKVFISFDYDNDRYYKNLLVAWDKNHLFDFGLFDGSVTVPVDSTDAAPIRRVISQHIADCPRFLCIVGEHTYKSRWVKWEIDKAVELKRKIIAVKTDRSNTTPPNLLNVGASWALSFTFDAIKKALEDA
jgi:hypothetical protein